MINSAPHENPDVVDLVASKVEELRKRLVDGSRRNPLINVPFRAGSASHVRVVDELPDILRHKLTNRGRMRLVPLPDFDEERPDEKTEVFLSALSEKRRTDEGFLAAIEALDPEEKGFAEAELSLERDLKDQIRDDLGLPPRQSKEKPNLEAHAKAHGIRPDYDLPVPDDIHEDGRHDDNDIQTLLTPDRLTRFGKGLRERAHAYERETGVNVLQTAIGLLEWRPPHENTNFVSPLMLLESAIERQQTPRGPEFYIRGTEQAVFNMSLALKLKNEHGINLDLEEDEGAENLFKRIAELAPPGFHWKVRREVVVGIFPSSKIAMYHDLNPTTKSVADNPLVARLLGTTAIGDGSYAEEYDVDAPEIERQAPYLVMDADASQYSAMIDVASGESTSIEGPPGSGKSQTIVNIIASAMAQGKKVLFVAEKLTALDVVRNRMQHVGLGEFVLPLQAGRSATERVYESLEERLAARARGNNIETRYEQSRSHFQERRAELQSYIDAISAPFESETVHDVLGHAISKNDVLKALPRTVRRMDVPGIKSMGPEHKQTLIDRMAEFGSRLSDLNGASPVWREAQKQVFNRDDADDMAEMAGELAADVSSLDADLAASPAAPLFPNGLTEEGIAAILPLLKVAEPHRDLLCPEVTDALLAAASRRALMDRVALGEEVLSEGRRLSEVVTDCDAPNLGRRLEAAVAFLEAEGLDRMEPEALEARIATARQSIAALEAPLAELARLPQAWVALDKPLISLKLLLQEMAKLDAAAHQEFLTLPAGADSSIGIVRQRAEALKTRLKDCQLKMPSLSARFATRSDINRLGTAADTLETTGIFGRIGKAYKAALKTEADMLGLASKNSTESRVADMRAARDLLDDILSFQTDQAAILALGLSFKGIDTDFDRLAHLSRLKTLANEHLQGRMDIVEPLTQIDMAGFPTLFGTEGTADFDEQFTPTELTEAYTRATTLKEANERALSAMKDHAGLFKKPAVTTEEVRGLIDTLNRMRGARADLDGFEGDSGVPEVLRHQPLPVLRALTGLFEEVSKSNNPAHAASVLRSGHIADIKEALISFVPRVAHLKQAAESFADYLELPYSWRDLTVLRGQIANLELARDTSTALIDCSRAQRLEEELRKEGYGTYVSWLKETETLPVTPEAAAAAILAKSSADLAISEAGDVLRLADGTDLARIRADIAEKDRRLIQMSQSVVRNTILRIAKPPAGNGVGRKSTYTDMALIYNERSKRRNRIGARDLTKRAGRALLELKPCWMMSPLAVAQYLHDDLQFDLVVIDEASQMTPENAIGALRRATQAVVVGDTKQLPPTNFFNKMLDDSELDDDLREDSESVLDMANNSFSPIRQLRWHYRSKHSGLIQFSNEWMYDGKLTIFPGANESDPDLGVHLQETGGLYKSGTNDIEAQAVIRAVVRHMETSPDKSLGVCTMNTDQKNLLIEAFEREHDRNPKVQAYVRKWEEHDDALEEFFIKNLETIQGDERDVMFISTLYGPEQKDGTVHQRFGPINSAYGHRRLNVLFSRAKQKIVTFTSMKPSDIRADDSKAKGVRMFRAWLEYCATGHIAEDTARGGEVESPFEAHVAQVIEQMGFEAVPQVGVAGFRVDLGIRHPEWPYGFLMGVECDGATYHSSASARDRDRLREDILRSRGWDLHRIWSTDWFTNQEGETSRIKEVLTTRLGALKKEYAKKPQLGLADIAPERPSAQQSPPAPQPAADTTPRPLQPDLPDLIEGKVPALAPQIEMRLSDYAQVGSRVRVLKLDDEKEMSFILSDRQNAPVEGIVGTNTPLGEALIDAAPGDRIEYQVGPHIKAVEVLSVEPAA